MDNYVVGISSVNSFIQFLTLVIVFVIVLFITYYTTKFIGSYQKNVSNGTNIENIETYRISNTKYIQILRIGNKYIAIAVCKDTITSITELDKDEVVIPEYSQNGQPFELIFNKIKELSRQGKDNKEDKDKNNEDFK